MNASHISVIHEWSLPAYGAQRAELGGVSPTARRYLDRLHTHMLRSVTSFDAEAHSKQRVFLDPILECKEQALALAARLWDVHLHGRASNLLTLTRFFFCMFACIAEASAA